MIGKILQKIHSKLESKAIVLMYHRIAHTESDPWQLAVAPEMFEEHLQVLHRHYQVLPIEALVKQLQEKKLQKKTIYITFDDVYTDNYINAKPLLEQYQLPATFFVPSYYVGSNKLFWWDELEQIFLHSHLLPLYLNISIQNKEYAFYLSKSELTQADKALHKTWVWNQTPPTERCKFYLDIWQLVQPLPIKDIEQTIDTIRNWAQVEVPTPENDKCMTYYQLQHMVQKPLLSVGIHTATHPALAFHSRNEQKAEITECISFLKKLSNKNSNFVAFPYGNYNEDTLSIVKELGISLGFTTKAQSVHKNADPACLGRYQIVNQTGKELHEKIQYWMSQT